jgi:hypothetical protein
MSSWQPPESKDDQSSHDPGVKEKEVIEERDFSETIYDLDWADYVVVGVLISIPAGFLATLLLWEFFPSFRDTAGAIVEAVVEMLPLVVAIFV